MIKENGWTRREKRMQVMELLKFLYKGASLLGLACGCGLFARYVYLEPSFPSRSSRNLFLALAVFFGFFCLLLPLEDGFGEFLGLIGIFFLWMLIIRKKRKIQGMFLLFPILGFFFAFTICFEAFFSLFGIYSVDKDSPWYLLSDGFFVLGLLLFWVRGKNWRKRYNTDHIMDCNHSGR